MSVSRFVQEIEAIKRDMKECEWQIYYHQDEMQRAHRQGESGIERYHRQEQLRWERKLRTYTRDLIQAERKLDEAKAEERERLELENQAKREGKSRNSWY
ncbi:MAG: hypothetical protein WBZ33_02305 [Thermoactinomyces sp.]|jgi:hypothetical protein